MMRAASAFPFSGGGIGLKSSGVLAQSAVAASVTGTLTETVLASIPIAAGAMSPNASLRINTLWSNNNNANAKTVRAYFGGTQVYFSSNTTNIIAHGLAIVRNRGVSNSQIWAPAGLGSYGSSATANGNGAIDTTIAQTVELRATLANVGDTITLEAYTVELLNP